jgi:hypothetical protein
MAKNGIKSQKNTFQMAKKKFRGAFLMDFFVPGPGLDQAS